MGLRGVGKKKQQKEMRERDSQHLYSDGQKQVYIQLALKVFLPNKAGPIIIYSCRSNYTRIN